MRNRPPGPSPQQVKQLQQHVRQAMLGAALDRAAHDDDGSPMTVTRAAEPLGPTRLAGVHPPGAARDEARALYAGCLRHYRETVGAQDLDSGVADAAIDDAGAAVAHFVAANLFALGSPRATPEMLVHLQRQLLPAARLSSNWVSASTTERQMFFEQVALLAVLIDGMAQHAASQDAAAQTKVRDAARLYLRQFLGLNPDALTLDAQGLALREPARARRAA
jgi:hypothetical protein